MKTRICYLPNKEEFDLMALSPFAEVGPIRLSTTKGRHSQALVTPTQEKLTIYAPMIYTAPHVMFLMRAYTDGLRGPVYLSGSMKQYRRVYGGGTSSAVGETGGGRGGDTS